MVDLETLNQQHPDSFKDDDWSQLVRSIKFKKCTPFIGSGACAGVLPTGRALAMAMADKHSYPFNDVDNLARVAQYCGREDNDQPKYEIIDEFKDKYPALDDPYEPHRVMAELGLPIYVTTNYDDFMARALKQALRTDTIREEVCRWYRLRARDWRTKGKEIKPTVEAPLVYHLHGDLRELASMVLTESDYLEFVLCWTEEPKLIPGPIIEAFSDSRMLFLGYSLDDFNFRLIFRRLASYMRLGGGRQHISVQLEPTPQESEERFIARARAQRDYLEGQLSNLRVKIYWGSCRQFATKLKQQFVASQSLA